jgi:hypothetical protein
LALVCSFNANAQNVPGDRFKISDKISIDPTTVPLHSGGSDNGIVANLESSEPCVTYTAEQALDATTDGNNNTFAAVYSTNATRNCGGKLGTSEKLIDAKAPANVPVSQGGAGCGVGNPECLKWDM